MKDNALPWIKTYSGFQDFQPQQCLVCRTVEDVQAAVATAAGKALRVRALGAGFSWGPEIKTAGICVDLTQMNRILDIDVAGKTVTVEAGAVLGDVSRALAARGLALPSLSFVTEATIGGVVSTGTHGTSAKWGTLSDFVRSMKVVLASGEIKEFGPDSPPDELRAARVAVGMLGVVVSVVLEAVEMPKVRFSELRFDLKTFRQQLPSVLEKYEHVWAHWTLGKDEVRIECLEARQTPAIGFRNYVDKAYAYWRPSVRYAQILTSLGFSTSWLLMMRERARMIKARLYGRRDPADVASSKAGDDKVFMSMQYGVPLADYDEAIDRIRNSKFAASNPGRVIELKFLKREDRSLLGPNVDRASVLFNLWWLVNDSEKNHVFLELEEVMQAMGARPHWGKAHTLPTLDYLQRIYPGWSQFEAVRKQYDPHDMFYIFA